MLQTWCTSRTLATLPVLPFMLAFAPRFPFSGAGRPFRWPDLRLCRCPAFLRRFKQIPSGCMHQGPDQGSKGFAHAKTQEATPLYTAHRLLRMLRSLREQVQAHRSVSHQSYLL